MPWWVPQDLVWKPAKLWVPLSFFPNLNVGTGMAWAGQVRSNAVLLITTILVRSSVLPNLGAELPMGSAEEKRRQMVDHFAQHAAENAGRGACQKKTSPYASENPSSWLLTQLFSTVVHFKIFRRSTHMNVLSEYSIFVSIFYMYCIHIHLLVYFTLLNNFYTLITFFVFVKKNLHMQEKNLRKRSELFSITLLNFV